jgi:hypothetical protein
MKKLISTLCVSGLFFAILGTVQAEKSDEASILEVIPGECILDGIFSSPSYYIDDMDGFEVPLVASWSPAEHNEKTRYAGDARFGVFNFKIGEGKLIETYAVDIDLTLDAPHINEARRDNQLIYTCEDDTDSCTATLVTVKAAITEQIARDNQAEVEEVKYQRDARATLLGVFVREMKPTVTGIRGEMNLHYRLTEVCGIYELTLTEGHAISSIIRQSRSPN